MKNLFLAITFLAVTSVSFAHQYKCKGVEGDNKGEFRQITVKARSLVVKFDNDATWDLWKGRLDESYKPRPANKDYVRFDGAFTTSGAEYTPWYLVQKGLVDGESKGYMKEQARGEGYFATKFFCWLTE